ncbi:hypothetical protein IAU60_004503 [Kwoniella sp. DSM 27419]
MDILARGLEHPDAVLGSDEACLLVAGSVEAGARYVAQHMSDREDEIDITSDDNIFHKLGAYWERLAQCFDPSVASEASQVNLASEDSRIQVALALGKLERNLVAGLLPFQNKAVEHEEWIRRLMFNVTTFIRIEDPRFGTLQAILAQLLCNLISPASADTGAERLAIKYLELYLSGRREDDVVIRMLDSKEAKVNQAILHLLNNVTRGSSERIKLLLTDPGLRWCAKLLGKMDDWVEIDDGLFELSASMFNHMIDLGLHQKLFTRLGDDTEPITPSQTILLKLLDSYLSTSPAINPSPSPHAFLVPTYLRLVAYSLGSVRQGADDPKLPKVFEALILVTESLNTIGLAVQGRKDRAEPSSGGDEEVVNQMKSAEPSGVIRPTVEILRSLDTFFPRINPRSRPSTDPTTPQATEELKPFANLKRNMVQMLGILSFEDTAVGDQVREAEGIQLLLSMTEIDESNPYLREHALLCVRNLMLGNPANQAIIKQMDPIGVLSEQTGELLPVPEKMKRKQ